MKRLKLEGLKVAFHIFGKKWILYHIWYIMKSRTYPRWNRIMKYMGDQFFSKKKKKKKKNQNFITFVKIQYNNSNCLENSIDNSSMQIFIFSLRLPFVTKEKKISPSKISHSSHWGECSLPLNVIWEILPVVICEQNFVESS